MYKIKNGVCPTLTAIAGTGGHNVPLIGDENGIRKLTPREVLTYKVFQRNWFPKEMANTQLIQAGNSVTVDMIKLFANKIYNCLLNN